MSFNGVDQYLDAQPVEPIGGPRGLTISAWVRRQGTGGESTDHIIDFGNGPALDNIVVSFAKGLTYEVYVGAVRKRLQVYGQQSVESSSTTDFPLGVWSHIAIVHAVSGKAYIYVDGELKAMGMVWLPEPVARAGYYIGKSFWPGDPLFAGDLKDVLIYNRPLSMMELDSERTGDVTPLLGSPIVALARSGCSRVLSGCLPAEIAIFNGLNQYVAATPTSPIGVRGEYLDKLDAEFKGGVSNMRLGGVGLTIMAWVSRGSTAIGDDRLLDFGNGPAMDNVVLSFEHELTYSVYRGNASQSVMLSRRSDGEMLSIPANKWVHLALVHSPAGEASLYIDGKVKMRDEVWLPKAVPRLFYYIGKSSVASDPYYKGGLKDLYVFNRALDLDELDGVRFGKAMPFGEAPAITFSRTWCENDRIPSSRGAE